MSADEDAADRPAGSRASRPRDAEATRRALLQAARRRFAYDGYAATTVRDVAADVGVNVALINRYFLSKEGLFEACVMRAGEDLRDGRPEPGSAERLASGIAAGVAGLGEELSLQMLLLLRSSGDAGGDRIRTAALRTFAERMAAIASGGEVSEARLLRAEILLATTLGIALLRSSTQLEPLLSAAADELTTPVRDLISTLLGDGGTASPG